MRLILSGMILAAALATAASAQEPAQPASPPPPAATTPAPAAVTPPAQPAAAPAAPAETAPPPPPPPTLPTTGDGAAAIAVLEKICVPAVRGQKLEDLAKANGFKLNKRDGTWVKPLGTDKNFTVTVFSLGSNKDVCNAELHFAQGQSDELAKALNIWAFVHQPPLDPTANYTQTVDPDGLRRVRRSWEYLTQNSSIGLNFSTVRKPDDTPLNAKWDTATMQYQERKF